MASAGGPGSSRETKLDPVLRNAMRYTVTPREYEAFHRVFIQRTPRVISTRAPHPESYDATVKSKDDFNAAAVRASLRVFIAAQTGLKLWDIISTKLIRRGGSERAVIPPKGRMLGSRNFRLSISVALILFLHRILHRFFNRLRANLLTKDAAPFRRRNPRISKALTARLAPAIGASLAGFALGLAPGEQMRVTAAIWVSTKALEFTYNMLEDEGYLKNKPWWFGSWLMMPPIYGQLLHAFVFDRDCFPAGFGNFIVNNTPNYIQRRPDDYPLSLPWPDNNGIVDGLANISKLKNPPFVSNILYPNAMSDLPSALAGIEPITSGAHPSIPYLSCALLHPDQPSCTRTFLEFFLQATPRFARIFTVILGALSLLRYQSLLKNPTEHLNKLAKSVLRLTIFVSGAIGTSWGSICLFQNLLPRNFMPTQRWFLGGFLGGLWGFVERKGGRGQFTYCARLSIDSLWKVGVKRGWWKTGRNGDVWVFVMGLMLLNVVYERNAAAVSSGILRKTLSSARGEGFVDRVKAAEDRNKADGEKAQ